MNLKIKRLTPELIEDYLYYFDHVAFTDNKEWEFCYCVHYHWNEEFEEERKQYKNTCAGDCFNRELATRLIGSGTLQGYLAYLDNVVVGWCNVNDKGLYSMLNLQISPKLWEDTKEDTKVKSIVCFSIAPDMRRMGIATLILDKICEDAKAEGYEYIEAYPYVGEGIKVHRNYRGPVELYNKFGFVYHNDLDDAKIIRKYLL